MSTITSITPILGTLPNLLSLYGFLDTGAPHPIALLPCSVGFLLTACVEVSADLKLHRKAMMGASLVALFVFAANVS